MRSKSGLELHTYGAATKTHSVAPARYKVLREECLLRRVKMASHETINPSSRRRWRRRRFVQLFRSACRPGPPRCGLDVVTVLERFLMRNDEGPMAYRALRRHGSPQSAFRRQRVDGRLDRSRQAGGFRYQVAAEGGSGYIRRRVFLAALDGEQKMWREGEPKRAQLNHANYSFMENGRGGRRSCLAGDLPQTERRPARGRLAVRQAGGRRPCQNRGTAFEEPIVLDPPGRESCAATGGSATRTYRSKSNRSRRS